MIRGLLPAAMAMILLAGCASAAPARKRTAKADGHAAVRAVTASQRASFTKFDLHLQHDLNTSDGVMAQYSSAVGEITTDPVQSYQDLGTMKDALQGVSVDIQSMEAPSKLPTADKKAMDDAVSNAGLSVFARSEAIGKVQDAVNTSSSGVEQIAEAKADLDSSTSYLLQATGDVAQAAADLKVNAVAISKRAGSDAA